MTARKPPKKQKKQSGRPSDYEPRFAEMAYIACSEGGFTDAKLAKLFKVSTVTINAWKKIHPEFLNSLKRGKDDFDCGTAETCLLKRIKGYKYIEVTQEPASAISEEDFDQNNLVVTKTITKYMAPDVKAIEFFLTNRNAARWKRVKHVELTGAGGGPLEMGMVDKEERQRLKDLARQQALSHIATAEDEENE